QRDPRPRPAAGRATGGDPGRRAPKARLRRGGPPARGPRARYRTGSREGARVRPQAVVGLAKLREERDRALEMRDGVFMAALARRDAPQPELADGLRGRLPRQFLVRAPARFEVTSVEERFR